MWYHQIEHPHSATFKNQPKAGGQDPTFYAQNWEKEAWYTRNLGADPALSILNDKEYRNDQCNGPTYWKCTA